MNQKTNLNRSEDDIKKSGGRKNHYIERNQEEQDKRIRSV